MRTRVALSVLLLVVAGSAAVLSFAALRDLALRCGFTPGLAWLLPLVVDAGAAAGSLVWLGGPDTNVGMAARRFARTLALALLGLSVAANALGHGLAAYALAPPWWVVVIVSAIAPAVLGAVVHLAVLAGRPGATSGAPTGEGPKPSLQELSESPAAELIAAGVGRRRLARELDISEHEARRLLDQARQTADADNGPDRAELASTNGHGGAR